MNPKASVLIVDDNPIHLELYRMIVEKGGFKGLPVLVSYGGMQFPENEPVHAVLLDYRLGPHLTVYDAARQIGHRYPDAPVLLLSDSYDAPSDTALVVQAFIRKGNPDKLLSTLHELLDPA
jgi:CheY-like chemotaxis protein